VSPELFAYNGDVAEILTLDRIKDRLSGLDVIGAVEEGFVAYSQGRVVVPPVAEMIFEDPPGDVHIKYGYIKGDDVFVIKVASGFYDNPKRGLSSSNGLMLLFSQKTGELLAVLLDEGHLTNVRTAAAGAVAAKYLAPRVVTRIGVLGAGIQGRMQLEYLRGVGACRDVTAWGVDDEELAAYRRDMEALGFRVKTTRDAGDVAAACNLIVTCTPSRRPLLSASQIRPGTHITAMGSDTAEKQELDAAILGMADRVVVDSLSQARLRGECFKAFSAGTIKPEDVVELGAVVRDRELQRASDEEITVADLTGVAVQDIQIAKAVWKRAS
jgi:ornithine cyclodeaminase